MPNISPKQFGSKMLPGATNMPNKVTPSAPKTPMGPKTPGFTTMPNKVMPGAPKMPINKMPGFKNMGG